MGNDQLLDDEVEVGNQIKKVLSHLASNYCREVKILRCIETLKKMNRDISDRMKELNNTSKIRIMHEETLSNLKNYYHEKFPKAPEIEHNPDDFDKLKYDF